MQEEWKEAEDGEVAVSRPREDKWEEEFLVRVGGGGMRRTGGRSALAKRRVTLLLRESRRGLRGLLKGLRMVQVGSEKEQVKETHLCSQVGERSLVGVTG